MLISFIKNPAHKYHLLVVLGMVNLVACTSINNDRTNTSSREEKAAAAKPPFTDTLAAVFSQIAYCTEPAKQLARYAPDWRLAWNGRAVGGNYAFAATDGEGFVIAFRGSVLSFTEDAFNNWIYHDLNIVKQEKWPFSNSSDAEISQGAYAAWQNIGQMKDTANGETLTAFLLRTVKADMPMYLTGHSLGGNLAAVYASWLWYQFNQRGQQRNNMRVITFAAPAAGNAAFAADFDSKFPRSIRVENKNDIVAKFPCSEKISRLGELFNGGPSAATITVGYKNLTTNLNAVFGYISKGLELLRFGGYTGYAQTCGEGRQISVALSGKNKNNTAIDWFAEAAYQHRMETYARATGAPVVTCE